MENGVFTCKCGALSNAHLSGKCRQCRQADHTPHAKRKRQRQLDRAARKPKTPAYGSQEWAETYSDDLGDSGDR
jgi:hypothetical protein